MSEVPNRTVRKSNLIEPYRERFYNTGPLINISLNESYRNERNHLIHCGVKNWPSILQYSLCLIIYIYIFLQGKGCPSHHGVLVQVHAIKLI